MLAEEKKGNEWTDFVKDWAKKNDTTYMVAIKDPAIKQAYKDSKKTKKKGVIVDNFTKLKDDAVAMAEAIDPPAEKKKAGRPSKYATDEERKEAKRLKTIASNKKKREEMSKKNKEGTMTEVEKEIWEHDTDLNVIRTTEMRNRNRAAEIARFTLIYNKLRNYIIDNEKEYLKNFEKDPYEIGFGKREESFEPKGKYQERAVEIFGKDPPTYEGLETIERKVLTPAEYELFRKPKIPNFVDGINEARTDIEGLKKKLGNKVNKAIWKGRERRGKEIRGMMEDDPFEKRQRVEKEKRDRDEAEARKRQREMEEKERDEKEKKRRAMLTATERAREDAEIETLYNKMISRFGVGGGLAGGGKGDETPTPDNPELYAKAKQLADKKYSKPSAYKSGFIVKKYKDMGGTYSGKKPSKEGIAGWFKENWENIAGEEDYPVYRPTKRVSKNTPLTPDEIAPENLRKQIQLKQKIKGNSNLPPFQGRGRFVSLVDNGFWN